MAPTRNFTRSRIRCSVVRGSVSARARTSATVTTPGRYRRPPTGVARRGNRATMAGMADAAVSEYVRGLPAAPLRPFIRWYSGYREVGVEPAVHRGLPSPYLTVIVTLDDPLDVAAHP